MAETPAISLEEQIIEHLRTLEDHHNEGDQKWLHTLIEDGLTNTASEISDLGALINITVIDAVAARFLNIKPNTVVKWALAKEYIKQIWEFNQLDMNILNKFLIEDSQQIAQILSILQPRQDNLEQSNQEHNQITSNNTNQGPSNGEHQVPEIEMEEHTRENSTTVEEIQIPEIIMEEQHSSDNNIDIYGPPYFKA
jgi:hypothetical protein